MPEHHISGLAVNLLFFRACLEVVLLKRKIQILGSDEGIFPSHSSATGRKNGKVRFQKLGFAAKMTTSKHALRILSGVSCLAVLMETGGRGDCCLSLRRQVWLSSQVCFVCQH